MACRRNPSASNGVLLQPATPLFAGDCHTTDRFRIEAVRVPIETVRVLAETVRVLAETVRVPALLEFT